MDAGPADRRRVREVIRLKSAIVAATVLSLCIGGEARGRTWYVYPNGVGGDAPTIQAAVDSAAVSGDKILLKGGVYRETGIVIDGKALLIDQVDGQAYLRSPSPGSGVCITARNISSGFSLNALAFRGFETAIALENASGYVQWPTLRECGRGVAISGGLSSVNVFLALIDSCGTGVEVNGGAAIVLQNLTIAHCGTGAAFGGGSSTFTRSIVYGCSTGVSCSGGAAASSCNDYFLNGTDYAGCAPGATDFYSDPKFCFAVAPAPGHYWLHHTSPCFTGENPCGVRCGALIAAAGCTGTAVEETSWGAVKALYR
jgi:hypothetical protein